MTLPPNIDGPRLLRPGELGASRRLDKIAFGNFSGAVEELPIEPEEPGSDDLDRTHIIFYDGEAASQIFVFHTPLHFCNASVQIGSIGGVGTHPAYRGHGLATVLLEHCAQQLVLGGARILLISGERGLYRRTGNVNSGKYATFRLSAGMLRAGDAPVSVRPVTPEDGYRISQIYQREPVRFERPVERFVEFLQPRPPFFHAEQWIVDLNGQPAAYLFLNVPWDEVGKPEPKKRCVFEYAGSRVALAGALASITASYPFERLLVPVAWQDADLIQLLCALGGQPEWGHMPDHTLRILNFPGLFNDLRPYLADRLPPTLLDGLRFEQRGPLLGHLGGDRLAIARGPDRLELDGAAMSALVLGDPYNSLRLDLPGALAEIIPAIFPLSSFLPGLDYH